MASPTAIEKNGIKWAETHPVGTGPFKLKEYERGVAKRYERFDDYWQKGRPYLDGVEFIVIKDPMTQVSAFKAGEVNGIWSVTKENASLLEKEGYPLQFNGPEHALVYGVTARTPTPHGPRRRCGRRSSMP